MPFSPFQPHPPLLLSPSSYSFSTSSQIEQQQQSSLTTRDIAGVTWHMIASSSSMWQDRKHSLTITYSPAADDTNAREFTDVTTWCADNSDKQSSTKGISSPLASESGNVYNWRGAGWLRMITTRWEIVGLGLLSPLLHADGADEGERESKVSEDSVVVLVTFVQKTVFSPQALSVFIRQVRLDDAQEENVIKVVQTALRDLGVESLRAEVDKLKAIPKKS
jgi:hypothetical protein